MRQLDLSNFKAGDKIDKEIARLQSEKLANDALIEQKKKGLETLENLNKKIEADGFNPKNSNNNPRPKKWMFRPLSSSLRPPSITFLW